LRAILYGYGGGVELRYLPIHADIKPGDLLITSGIDGLYPEGAPVAEVTQVEHNSDTAFVKVTTIPTAGVDRGRFVLVLREKTGVPARPLDSAAAPATKTHKPSQDDSTE
jgi:rod shape-determining protein MreC